MCVVQQQIILGRSYLKYPIDMFELCAIVISTATPFVNRMEVLWLIDKIKTSCGNHVDINSTFEVFLIKRKKNFVRKDKCVKETL